MKSRLTSHYSKLERVPDTPNSFSCLCGNLLEIFLSQEEQSKERIRRLLDLPLSEDFDDYGSLSILDASIRVHGPEGVRAESMAIQKACPDFHSTDEETFLADGDRVVIIHKLEGTHTGEFMGIPPTGKKFSIRSISIYRATNGKIVEDKGMVDWFSLFKQLGLIPPLTSLGQPKK